MGEGPRGSNGARSTLHRISATPSATHSPIGPLWCWFLSGWACAHPRPLWVSPTTSPVRLGVSPAAAPTPRGTFNQRFEALFHRAGALGVGRMEWSGGEWDNCNSIINKYIKKKRCLRLPFLDLMKAAIKKIVWFSYYL